MGNQNSHSAPVVLGEPVSTSNATTSAPAAAQELAKEEPAPAKLDLVFTMDCTGSMGSYIQSAKQNIELIARRLADAKGYDLRFGLVAYRDHPPQDQTFVTKSFPFTSHVQEMQQRLSTLRAQGGGDGPEAVAAALRTTRLMNWRDDATKVVIFIADAPPHGLGEDGDGFPDGAPDGVDPLVELDEISKSGICIYTVGCQPALSGYRFAVDFFVGVAERTNGQAVSLGSASALADVILGSAIEEVELQKLGDELARDVQAIRATAPGIDDEQAMEQVSRLWQAKGHRTSVMRGHTVLKSKHAGVVRCSASLASAKASLTAVAPAAAPPPRGAVHAAPHRACSRRGVPLARRRAAKYCDPGPMEAEEYVDALKAACPGASAPCDDSDEEPTFRSCGAAFGGAASKSVAVEEDVISTAQVARLYQSRKKRGAL